MAAGSQMPDDIGSSLRHELRDSDDAAKETALVELYRQQKLSHVTLARFLGLSRFETDALLKRHNVTEDLMTVADLREELGPLRQPK